MPGQSDSVSSLIMDTAAMYELAVIFHIEPYKGRDALSVREDIMYLTDTYGASFPASTPPRSSMSLHETMACVPARAQEIIRHSIGTAGEATCQFSTFTIHT